MSSPRFTSRGKSPDEIGMGVGAGTGTERESGMRLALMISDKEIRKARVKRMLCNVGYRMVCYSLR